MDTLWGATLRLQAVLSGPVQCRTVWMISCVEEQDVTMTRWPPISASWCTTTGFSLASNRLQFDPLISDLPPNTTWWVRRSHMTRVSCSLTLCAPEGSITQSSLQTLHILHPPSTSERRSFCQTLVCLWKRLQMIFRAAESLFKSERVVRSSFIHSFICWMREFWSMRCRGWKRSRDWLGGTEELLDKDHADWIWWFLSVWLMRAANMKWMKYSQLEKRLWAELLNLWLCVWSLSFRGRVGSMFALIYRLFFLS